MGQGRPKTGPKTQKSGAEHPFGPLPPRSHMPFKNKVQLAHFELGEALPILFCPGDPNTPIGKGAVHRSREKNLENHSAGCIPSVLTPPGWGLAYSAAA